MVGRVLAIALSAACPAEVAAAPPVGVLALRGGFLPGTLLDSPAAAPDERPTIRWQSPLFARPLVFPAERVAGISFAGAAEAAGDVGPWRIDLAGGDTISGSIERIDADHVVVRTSLADGPAALAVRRSAVRLIGREGASGTFLWNGQLAAWTPSAADDWEKSGKGLANTVPGATLARPIGGAPRQRIDLTLGWSDPPRLRITVRSDATPAQVAAEAEGRDRPGLPVRMGLMVPGDDGLPKPPPPAPYVIEIDEERILAIRDEADDVGRGRAVMRTCGAPPERGLSLTLFVDRVVGGLVVMRGDADEARVDVALPPAVPPSPAELVVEVVSGTVSLDDVRVSTWRGPMVTGGDHEVGSVVLRDGDTVAGSIATSVDDPSVLVVRADGAAGASRSIPLDDVVEILLPSTGAAADAPVPVAGFLRCVARGGSVLSGRLDTIGDGRVWIAHPAIEGAIGLPLEALVTIDAAVPPGDDAPLPGRVGRLVADGASLEGCLVPVEPADGEQVPAAAIGWLPAGALGASPFALAASGAAADATIRYVAAPKADPLADRLGWIGAHIGMLNDKPAILGVQGDSPLAAVAAPVPALILAVAPRGDGRFVETAGLPVEDVTALVRGRVGTEVQLRLTNAAGGGVEEVRLERAVPRFLSDQQSLEQVLATHRRLLETVVDDAGAAPADGFGSLLVLVTGESVACRVERIGADGVEVSMPGGGGVTIPTEHVQAVELIPGEGIAISAEKFRTLTTLPRAQRGVPPTHLVRSAQGDYLRGRIVGMDETSLRIVMESDPRGKPSAIPRSEVARVIWLHPESLEDDWRPPEPPAAAGLTVTGISGNRTLTRFAAASIAGDVLSGTHPILGPHGVDLESVDRLLVGDVLEIAPRMHPYAQWTLQPAAEPRNQPKPPPRNAR